jgi:penicillin amidase
VGGDSYTVNVSRVSLKADSTTGEYYLSEHGPSLRGLYDLADRSNSRVVHSTGQSGIVWSPLFRSLAEPWRRVEGVPLFVPASALTQTLSISPAP